MINTSVAINLDLAQAEQLLRLIDSGALIGSVLAEIEGLREATVASILKRKREAELFDVFLCHNSVNKPQVKQIGERLKNKGILPWLDEWELRPGLPWQRVLESQIKTIRAAAIFVGKDGRGPWQDMELDAFIRQFVTRACPVIPILLRSVCTEPDLPTFLDGMTFIKLSKRKPDPLEQIIWGITGIHPENKNGKVR